MQKKSLEQKKFGKHSSTAWEMAPTSRQFFVPKLSILEQAANIQFLTIFFVSAVFFTTKTSKKEFWCDQFNLTNIVINTCYSTVTCNCNL